MGCSLLSLSSLCAPRLRRRRVRLSAHFSHRLPVPPPLCWFISSSQFNVQYKIGVDGIGLVLVLLTTLLSAVSILSSWDAIHERLGLTRRFYDRFTPAISARDFTFKRHLLDRALDFLAVCR